ncbi:hypothetical protein CRUP_014776 [Coryphaenoides rupestris]|nr:hypothetical protein CRUP_014776 [Coryphaenoides rupestris]
MQDLQANRSRALKATWGRRAMPAPQENGAWRGNLFVDPLERTGSMDHLGYQDHPVRREKPVYSVKPTARQDHLAQWVPKEYKVTLDLPALKEKRVLLALPVALEALVKKDSLGPLASQDCRAWTDFQGKMASRGHLAPRESRPKRASRETADCTEIWGTRDHRGREDRPASQGRDSPGRLETRACLELQDEQAHLGIQVTRECTETRGCSVSLERKVNSALLESDFVANLAPKDILEPQEAREYLERQENKVMMDSRGNLVFLVKRVIRAGAYRVPRGLRVLRGFLVSPGRRETLVSQGSRDRKDQQARKDIKGSKVTLALPDFQELLVQRENQD